MVEHINLMLLAAKHVGAIREMAMSEACSYAPKRISITGTTESGENFSLTLEVGELKRDV